MAPRVSAQIGAGSLPVIAVSGSCPESSAVEKVLSTVLPASVSLGSATPPTVSDLGDAYVVAVGERVKKYADSSRDCADRARVAAAFIALAFSLEAQPVASASNAGTAAALPPDAPLRDVSALPAVSRRWLRVDARGALEVAPQGGLVAPGAALGFAAGWNRIGVHALCGWLSGASIGVAGGSGSVRLERFPCAAGPMLKLFPGASRLEINLDAGMALGAMLVSGRGFASDYGSARFELGARFAVEAALHLGPRRAGLSPVIGLEASYYPMVYDLFVMPRGVVGHAPSVWAGLTAGVCWNGE